MVHPNHPNPNPNPKLRTPTFQNSTVIHLSEIIAITLFVYLVIFFTE